MDIIGSLPDDILCHILSFFPIKEAALTSLLSKRWRNLFVFIPNLHLDYFNYRNNPNNYTSFRDFVDRVLTVSGNSPLKKFALKHPQSNDAARVNSWICNVLSRGVLDLNLYLDGNYMYSLPLEIFSCKTIVNLKLGMNFDIGMVPENASLPALRTLFLDYIDFSSNFEALLSACHVLEELTMYVFDWDYWEQCRTVSCPTLQRLIINCYGSTTFDLSRRKTVTDGYPIVNFDSLVEAKLTLASRKHPQKGSPENLIKGLRNVEILELSSFQTSEVRFTRFLGLQE